MDLEDRIKGVIFGVALGDALGGPLEFMKQEDIRWEYGLVEQMLGGGWLELEPGETTDDTAMMLCIIKGILDNPDDPIEEIGKHFLDWYASKPKAIGSTTEHALKAYLAEYDWLKAGELAHRASHGKSAGNGALMRCGPIAFFYRDNYEKMIEITIKQSRMTHIDPVGIEACCIKNHIIWEFLQERTLEEGIKKALDKYDTHHRYRDCLDKNLIYKDLKPTGFAVDTLRCSLYALLHTKDYHDAVVMAVNMGGDADTIGAVTGGMAGAYYGYSSMPAVWMYQLKCFHEIDELWRLLRTYIIKNEKKDR
ncbi:MAG: ADP-ribosylglycohydrolase family protein [Thermotaleaceae bacterium]